MVPVPHVELDAEDEKNREGNGVVIRADLAEDLKHWLADKLAALQAEARDRGEPIPARLPANTPLSSHPEQPDQDFRPRPDSGRDRKERRPGPNSRRACTSDDLRHPLEPGRGSFADSSSRHAAF